MNLFDNENCCDKSSLISMQNSQRIEGVKTLLTAKKLLYDTG